MQSDAKGVYGVFAHFNAMTVNKLEKTSFISIGW